MRERLRQAIEKGNALEGELEETREKVRTCQYFILYLQLLLSPNNDVLICFCFCSSESSNRRMKISDFGISEELEPKKNFTLQVKTV